MKNYKKISTLSIDLETYSSVDLVRSGVYPYTASLDFEILLFAYGVDEEPVEIVDLTKGEEIPWEIIEAIRDKKVIKRAFNAAFERVCLSTYLKEELKAESWRCTAVQAAAMGYPLSLEGAAKALGLQVQKMTEGRELIKFFTMPCKGTKFNGGRTRNSSFDNEEKWRTFKEYCKRDVEVERAVNERLNAFQLSEREQQLYELDQRINQRGVLVDLKLVHQAVRCDELYGAGLLRQWKELTKEVNPKSPAQVKLWLKERGIMVESLSKKVVEELIMEGAGLVKEITSGQEIGLASDTDLIGQDKLERNCNEVHSVERICYIEQVASEGNSEEVSKLLKLRLSLSKTSIKKYEAIKRSVCRDNRVRGLFQFYGASRTGRWSGRLVQVQNLPQNREKDIGLARELIKEGAFEEVEMLYENSADILSQLIRTAFIPKAGHKFIVVDFSAIEARVLAWLSGEGWRLRVFERSGKIYEASASLMFGVPEEAITKGSALRQKGKIAELALGYGGSVGALTAMGALEMGLKEEELKQLVRTWRSSNPHITRFWWSIGLGVIRTITTGNSTQVGRIKMFLTRERLLIELPSGRRLSYVKPRVETNNWGSTVISYEGITTGKKWGRIESYGPKFVENIVQGIARDILGEAMLRLEEAGYRIVMHIHDEVIIEEPLKSLTLEGICEIMKEPPQWAKGLPLEVDGFQCDFYRK